MSTRAEQRQETREKIITAAISAFAKHGFHGASTREISTLASVNQGLLTYHFSNKDALWRACADKLFNDMRMRLQTRVLGLSGKSAAKEAIKEYVRIAAEWPELYRFMLEEGKHSNERMQWLVETHLRPGYEAFAKQLGYDKALQPHAFYTLVGAGSTMFAISGEVRSLTQLDISDPATIEAHAEFLANLLMRE
ncbi:MAG: TetR/AcrR family transcriptional regulator [Pseudomonadota bacterium]